MIKSCMRGAEGMLVFFNVIASLACRSPVSLEPTSLWWTCEFPWDLCKKSALFKRKSSITGHQANEDERRKYLSVSNRERWKRLRLEIGHSYFSKHLHIRNNFCEKDPKTRTWAFARGSSRSPRSFPACCARMFCCLLASVLSELTTCLRQEVRHWSQGGHASVQPLTFSRCSTGNIWSFSGQWPFSLEGFTS